MLQIDFPAACHPLQRAAVDPVFIRPAVREGDGKLEQLLLLRFGEGGTVRVLHDFPDRQGAFQRHVIGGDNGDFGAPAARDGKGIPGFALAVLGVKGVAGAGVGFLKVIVAFGKLHMDFPLAVGHIPPADLLALCGVEIEGGVWHRRFGQRPIRQLFQLMQLHGIGFRCACFFVLGLLVDTLPPVGAGHHGGYDKNSCQKQADKTVDRCFHAHGTPFLFVFLFHRISLANVLSGKRALDKTIR